MAPSMVFLVVLLVSATLISTASAATYKVGDSTGWVIPDTATFFDEWSAKQTFVVGDKLSKCIEMSNDVGLRRIDIGSCTILNFLLNFIYAHQWFSYFMQKHSNSSTDRSRQQRICCSSRRSNFQCLEFC